MDFYFSQVQEVHICPFVLCQTEFADDERPPRYLHFAHDHLNLHNHSLSGLKNQFCSYQLGVRSYHLDFYFPQVQEFQICLPEFADERPPRYLHSVPDLLNLLDHRCHHLHLGLFFLMSSEMVVIGYSHDHYDLAQDVI